jgi:hypothetical protein
MYVYKHLSLALLQSALEASSRLIAHQRTSAASALAAAALAVGALFTAPHSL